MFQAKGPVEQSPWDDNLLGAEKNGRDPAWFGGGNEGTSGWKMKWGDGVKITQPLQTGIEPWCALEARCTPTSGFGAEDWPHLTYISKGTLGLLGKDELQRSKRGHGDTSQDTGHPRSDMVGGSDQKNSSGGVRMCSDLGYFKCRPDTLMR